MGHPSQHELLGTLISQRKLKLHADVLLRHIHVSSAYPEPRRRFLAVDRLTNRVLPTPSSKYNQ